jgi:hypothetical protein
MAFRYRAIIVLTLALFLPGVPAAAKRTHAQRTTIRPTPVENIYSQRALRRARIILQLKLLELESERLERVREAILRHLPVDQLLKMP